MIKIIAGAGVKKTEELTGRQQQAEQVEADDADEGAGGEGDDPGEDYVLDHREVKGAQAELVWLRVCG